MVSEWRYVFDVILCANLNNVNLEAPYPTSPDYIYIYTAKALEQLKGDDKYNSIFHVAGGWAGGSVSDPGFLESVDKMWKFNLQSAALASYFAGRYTSNRSVSLPCPFYYNHDQSHQTLISR